MYRLSSLRCGGRATVLVALLAVCVTASAMAAGVAFEIAAGEAPTALKAFAAQAHLQLLFDYKAVQSLKTPAVKGQLEPSEALKMLLRGTGLTFREVNDHTIAVIAPGSDSATSGSSSTQSSTTADAGKEERNSFLARFRVAQVDQGAPSGDSSVEKEQASKKKPVQLEEYRVSLPEVLVIGSKSLNTDIERTRDDIQPYVIFDRAAIEASGATDIEDFLKLRLPMNTIADTPAQSASIFGNMSQINLRGLGANQTLILVDGHRTASPSTISGPQQSDLNGIPLAAVERIEVLPTTASGIYGGSATGGVINVILRRDYTGAELKVNYDNTFHSDSAVRSIDLSAGFTPDGGKTNVLVTGHLSDAGILEARDRDFIQRGRALILARHGNDPTALNLAGIIPPLGAATNIRSQDGSPLFGPGTPNFTTVPTGYPGGGGLAPLQANAGHYNLALADSAQASGGGRFALLNGPTVQTFNTSLRHQFTSNLQVFLELGASNNTGYFSESALNNDFFALPANAPNNPFGQAVWVTFPSAGADLQTESRNYDRRLVGGIIVGLPKEWRAETDYTWNRSRWSFSVPAPLTAATMAAISNGALDTLRDTSAFPLDFSPYLTANRNSSPFNSTLKDATLRLAGPVGSLPAGAPALTVLVEHRDELIADGTEYNASAGVPSRSYPSRSQSVDSAYLEAKVPLVSSSNHIPGVQQLELQLAGRRDDYTIKGSPSSIDTAAGSAATVDRVRRTLSSTNPTVGLRYQPLHDLMLRASYSTGFLPPSTEQLVPTPVNFPGFPIVDTKRGNTVTPVLFADFGGNPNLRPEKSKSWSAGTIITPRFVPGFRLSVDYTRIDKSDNITSLPFQSYVTYENLFPGTVIRGPVPPNDPYGVGPIVSLSQLDVNIARALVEAYDVALDYHRETAAAGAFDLFALATWETHYKTQIEPAAPFVENAGVTSTFPLKLRANGGLTWKYHRWTLGWTTRYFSSYLVADPTDPNSAATFANQGSQHVPSQVYHDIFGSYRFGESGTSASHSWQRLLNGVEVRLQIKNIFNTEPPFDANAQTYYYSPFGDPRLGSYNLSIRKVF